MWLDAASSGGDTRWAFWGQAHNYGMSTPGKCTSPPHPLRTFRAAFDILLVFVSSPPIWSFYIVTFCVFLSFLFYSNSFYCVFSDLFFAL